VVHQEVPGEDAAVMPVGEPRKRRRDRRNLAARRRQKEQDRDLDARRRRKKEQKRTQRKDGCRKNLVAARRAAVAWRKINVFRKILTHGFCELRKEVTAARMKNMRCSGHRHKRQNKNNDERETRNGRTEQTGRWKGPVCENGSRNRGLKQQLRSSKRIKNPTVNNTERRNPQQRAPLGSGGPRKEDICDILREKIMEHEAGTSGGLRGREKRTLWRGRPPRNEKRSRKQRRSR
jgi:hypothetical protein